MGSCLGGSDLLFGLILPCEFLFQNNYLHEKPLFLDKT